MTNSLSPEVRPRAFAAVELLLDMSYIGQTLVNADLESMLIYFCIAEATMRPLLLGPNTPPDVLLQVEPPEEYRGSISRLMISDRTGLPRETVRRKTNAMVKAGLLSKDKDGRVRVLRILGNPVAQKAANDAFAAVQRYQARLRQFGCATAD